MDLEGRTLTNGLEYYLDLNPEQLRREYQAAKQQLDELAKVRISHEATNAP